MTMTTPPNIEAAEAEPSQPSPPLIGELKELAFTDIYMDSVKENSRGAISLSEVTGLAENIRADGLHQPPLVSPTPTGIDTPLPYMLVCGYRRMTALREILQWEKAPVIVRTMTLEQIIAANLHENLERQDLNIMQEARAIRRLLMMQKSRKRIATLLGKTEGWVQVRTYALTLPPGVQEQIAAGLLTTEHIRDLNSIKDPDTQIQIARRIVELREKSDEKLSIIKPAALAKKHPARIAKHRGRAEIQEFLTYLLREGFESGLHTRCLAWAAGNINSEELGKDLKAFADELGLDWRMPEGGFPRSNEVVVEGVVSYK